MHESTLIITAIGAAFGGLSLFVWRLLSGIAEIKRVNFEGQVKVLRAERGDKEPPVIVHMPPSLPTIPAERTSR